MVTRDFIENFAIEFKNPHEIDENRAHFVACPLFISELAFGT